jgi:hypothetical protein
VAGKDLGKSTFAGSIGAHYGVNFAGAYFEVDAAEDFFTVDGGVEVLYLEHV